MKSMCPFPSLSFSNDSGAIFWKTKEQTYCDLLSAKYHIFRIMKLDITVHSWKGWRNILIKGRVNKRSQKPRTQFRNETSNNTEKSEVDMKKATRMMVVYCRIKGKHNIIKGQH